MERQRPDRFDGDASPGKDADICPSCGYAAPVGEFSVGHERICPVCDHRIGVSSSRPPYLPEGRPGANTWG